MAAIDDLYLQLVIEMRLILRRLRIASDFEDDKGNFIPGKGESIYSTFFRAIGLIKYSEQINAFTPLEQRVEEGRNLVDRLFKGKTEENETRKKELITFLQGLQKQLDQYLRNVSMMKIKRIRKRIGPSVEEPRETSLISGVEFTDDLDENVRIINEKLREFEFEQDNAGQLVQEIDLLAMFLDNLNVIINSTLNASVGFGSTSSNNPDQLGEIGGSFISLLKAQTASYQQRFDNLVNRRVALNSQLRLLEEKMRNLRTGVKEVTEEPFALLSVVDTLIFLLQDVKYTCAECRHFSLQPIEAEQAQIGGTEDDIAREEALLEAGRQRAEQFAETGKDQGANAFCTYRASNLPTAEKRSCLEVWGLVSNDFWQASDDAEDGRVDIVQMARDKMNPRKR